MGEKWSGGKEGTKGREEGWERVKKRKGSAIKGGGWNRERKGIKMM